jgi:hypothetical protein
MTQPPSGLTVPVLRVVLVAAALTGAASALILAWFPTATAVSTFVIEDLGYYLTAARHVLAGQGATLDGVNPTNGFHPLWLLLICGVEALFGTTGTTAVHVTLTLAALIFLATGVLLCWRIYRNEAAWLVPPVAALLFLNYRLLSVPLGGLETGLAGLFAVAVAITATEWADALTVSRAILLGALVGGACLARMDAPLLGGIVLGWMAWRAWRHRDWRQVALLTLCGATAAVCLLPWFVFSWRAVHHWLPQSGVALLLWAPSLWSRPWTLTGLIRASRLTIIGPAGNIANELGVWPLVNTGGITRASGAIAFAMVIVALAGMAWRVRDDARVRRASWIPVFGLCLWAYYTQMDKEHIRYLNPAVLLLFYGAAMVIDATYRRSHNRERFVRIVYVSVLPMLLCLTVAGLTAYRKGFGTAYTHRMQGALYEDLAPWLRANTNPDAVVGAFNGGIISYFSGRRTVNLDGVMSEPTITALRDQRLCTFIDEQHIAYLADNESAIAYFFDRDGSCRHGHWQSQWRERHRVAWPPSSEQNQSNWVVWERVGVH